MSGQSTEPDEIKKWVDECMEIQKILMGMAGDGFTKVVLANPTTGEKKVIKIPEK